jgi:hypothetical protein
VKWPYAARVVLLSLITLAVSLDGLPSGEAAGPWQAQVVSAETEQPLEGVVVLAWWTRHVRGLGGPSEEYHDSQEVLTDTDGRFTIDARWFFSLNPLVFFRGPFFAMFKAGYGRFGWPGYQGSEQWPKEKRDALRTAAQLLQVEGIVLEMPHLESIEQRRDYLGKLEGDYLVVPLEHRLLLQNAIREERRALGYRSLLKP